MSADLSITLEAFVRSISINRDTPKLTIVPASPGHAVISWSPHIVVDGETVFSAALDPSAKWPGPIYIGGTNYSANATVHIGSLVDFLISPALPENGGAFGPVKFTATIRTAP